MPCPLRTTMQQRDFQLSLFCSCSHLEDYLSALPEITNIKNEYIIYTSFFFFYLWVSIPGGVVVKLKTRVVNNDCNPVWNEHLTLSVKDMNDPIHLTVYDKDRFSGDDKMGDADIDIQPYLEAMQMGIDFQKLPNGCAIKRVRPSRANCLAEESSILWNNGKITQDMILRLKNVECGEVEIMLEWIDGPGCKGLAREGSKKTPWMPTKRLD
ncbi:PREDICTED: protein C2-DOMAIN ABA-RELATED 9 isoform X1 [Tarenaya hassleriana]|uniref:protein C2-DOMAIN ABA-RELATED 9 isoform X1 n=1 Tax=Tarenaya hassleriana TaxID=28532 RepID=UPI0008FD949A|nr:PREDICTED: protein C2-DOMAIN ABA-RELATED 9 isoform X1 [Tarenaya hassleriana]